MPANTDSAVAAPAGRPPRLELASRAARGCPGHITPLPHPACPSENFQGFKKSKYGNIIPWFCGWGGKEHEVLCWVLPTNVKFSH